MTNTATVQALTAEVHVLMVGNRQITLSVARQLDEVELELMEPFGRVRLDKDRQRYVIGKRHSTGDLVVALYEREFEIGVPFVFDHDLTGSIRVCRSASRLRRAHGLSSYELDFNGTRIHVDKDATEPCERHGEVPIVGSEPCTGWFANGLEEEITAVVHDHKQRKQLHADAGTLPLIVLAGLR